MGGGVEKKIVNLLTVILMVTYLVVWWVEVLAVLGQGLWADDTRPPYSSSRWGRSPGYIPRTGEELWGICKTKAHHQIL